MEAFGIRSIPPCGDCDNDGECTMNCGPAYRDLSAREFRNVFAIMMNIDMCELEEAGIIRKGNVDNGGQSWARFNDDPLSFVLKLDERKLDALTALVNSRMPKRLMQAPALRARQEEG